MSPPGRRSGPHHRGRSNVEKVATVTDVGIVPQPADTGEIGALTRAERDDLAKVARLRARVARSQVAQREAELLADVEKQLAAQYDIADEAWQEVTAAATQAVQEADRQVAERCRERGIPQDFRPSMHVSWFGRGANAVASRRAELRRVAQTRITAAGKAAKASIEAREAEILTELLAGGLTSDAARAFLQSIPTPAELMPPLAVAELEGAARSRDVARHDELARYTP